MRYGMNHPVFSVISENYNFFTQNKDIMFLPDFSLSFYFAKLQLEKLQWPEKEWQATWEICGHTWCQSSSWLVWKLRTIPAANEDVGGWGKGNTDRQYKAYPEMLASCNGWVLRDSYAQEETKGTAPTQGWRDRQGSGVCLATHSSCVPLQHSHQWTYRIIWPHMSAQPWLSIAFCFSNLTTEAAMTAICGRKHELFTPTPCHQSSCGDVFGLGVPHLPPPLLKAMWSLLRGGRVACFRDYCTWYSRQTGYNRQVWIPALGNCWILF